MAGNYERTAEHRAAMSDRFKGTKLSPESVAKRTASRRASDGYGETHGHGGAGRRTPTYNSWSNMIQRCTNPRNTAYSHYGGRGITVCERWLKFENFLADMGERPDGLTLDRIDNDGNYEPGNCRWVTQAVQLKNRRAYKRREAICHPERKHCARGMCERCYANFKQGRMPRDISGTAFEAEVQSMLDERARRRAQ